MRTKVYWCPISSDHKQSDLLAIEPKRLSSAWGDLFPSKADQILKSCSSMQDWMRNAYIIYSPIDFTVFWDDKDRSFIASYGYNQYSPIAHGSSVLQLHNLAGYFFFSEKNGTELTISPPFIHDGPITRGLQGRYDCGSWCRPISTAAIGDKHKDIFVKRGDPIGYVAFDRPVVLQRFEMTDEIDDVIKPCLGVKSWQKHMPLKKLYELFHSRKIRAKLLNIIKNQT